MEGETIEQIDEETIKVTGVRVTFYDKAETAKKLADLDRTILELQVRREPRAERLEDFK